MVGIEDSWFTLIAMLIVLSSAAPAGSAAGGDAKVDLPDVPTVRPNDRIQPGDPLGNGTGGFDPLGCSISYVFDTLDTTYVAAPATCVDANQTVSTPSYPEFGRVVHENPGVDTALVRVDTDHEPNVSAALANHPGLPQGVSKPGETRPGDLIVTPHGAGSVLYHDHGTVQLLATSDERLDGTPIVHAATGNVMGHLSSVFACVLLPVPTTSCGVPPIQQAGPALGNVIEELRTDGFDVQLRNVDGPAPERKAGSPASEATRAALDFDEVIQPGDPLTVGNGRSICTYNFVFDGPQHTYLGTAAHCVSEDQQVGTSGYPHLGEVVHVGGGADFALVQVREGLEDRVQASVKGHPSAPLGVAERNETARGDLLYVSGYGTGFQGDDTTRENRWGVQLEQTVDGYEAVAPFSFGDSGGPVVHAPTGQAFGVVSYTQVCVHPSPSTDCTVPPVRVGGPTIDKALEVAHEHGFDVELRTTDAGLRDERTLAEPASTVTQKLQVSPSAP